MANFSSQQSFFLFISFFTCFAATTSSAFSSHYILAESKPTKKIDSVHDLLPKFGLPKGLLPDVVKSYSLADDGGFSIELERACYVQFDDLVYYDKKIVGKLTYGSISDLSGIQAKKLFVWVPVSGIEVDSAADLIEFHVGFLSEKLPAKQFEEIPTCKNKACRGSGMVQQEYEYALEMAQQEPALEIVEREYALVEWEWELQPEVEKKLYFMS